MFIVRGNGVNDAETDVEQQVWAGVVQVENRFFEGKQEALSGYSHPEFPTNFKHESYCRVPIT